MMVEHLFLTENKYSILMRNMFYILGQIVPPITDIVPWYGFNYNRIVCIEKPIYVEQIINT